MNIRLVSAHRNVLVVLTRYLMQDRGGGLMSAALEMLTKVLPVCGALAYRSEPNELVLVGEQSLPRKAKPWLAHLPLGDQPWFIAQHVGLSMKPQVDEQVAESRMGHSIRPVLEAAGWNVLAAAPIHIGRKLCGAIVLAGASAAVFDKDSMLLLETVAGILALALDRERARQQDREDKLQQAKTAQLATMGLLASTAACDLAAPLGSMQLQVEDQQTLLERLKEKLAELAESPEVGEELDELEELNDVLAEALRQAQGVTSRLLAFSRESRRQTVDLTHVVDSTVAMLQQSVEARGIALRVSGDDSEMLVDGRPEALQMLVVQLLLYVTQECETTRTKSPSVQLRLSSEGMRHQLTFESNCVTGKRSNLHIFDNYVAKQRGAQAMVGLALAKQMVLAHNGHIEFGASHLGGAFIRVVLPVSKSAEPRPERRFDSRPPPPSADVLQRPLPLVVWIDDDNLFVRSMRRCLKTHRVESAQSIAEGLELLGRLDQEPRLVFCDVNLPDGRGMELHEQAPPELQSRFVFVTGGVIPADAADYLVSSGRPTLIKPISLDEIAVLLSDSDIKNHPSVAPTLAEDMPTPLVPPDEQRRARRRRRRRQAATVQESPIAKTTKDDD